MGRSKQTIAAASDGNPSVADEISALDTAAADTIFPDRINGRGPATDQLLDLNQLRVPQNFADMIGVKRALLTVPARKPDRQEWVRVRAEEAFRLTTYLLQLKEERTAYLVHPNIAAAVPAKVRPMTLFTAINRQGVTFLWPAQMPDVGGRRNAWAESALDAANLAMKRWVRVVADMSLGAYQAFTAEGALDEPEWPDVTFQELLSIAFKGRFITTPDHDVLLHLRGQK
jgi:hypothetical protein